jgi:hypothetical protein
MFFLLSIGPFDADLIRFALGAGILRLFFFLASLDQEDMQDQFSKAPWIVVYCFDFLTM